MKVQHDEQVALRQVPLLRSLAMFDSLISHSAAGNPVRVAPECGSG